MYKKLDGIISPEDGATLWRYMSLEKFVNMLETKSLFFSRADKFEDPFEGFIPSALVESYRDSIKRVILDENFTEVLIKISENSRKYVMCNCWHQNEAESMAMWEKYHMRYSGVAIKTTMQDLKKSFRDKPNVFIGEIEYSYYNTYGDHHIRLHPNGSLSSEAKSDLSSNTKWTYFPYFHKRVAFEHEHEVRIVIDVEPYVRDYLKGLPLETILKTEFPDICDVGISLEVDVNTLIDEVVTSPYTEDWVTETVIALVHRYGYDFDVNSSKLLDDPDLNIPTSDPRLLQLL